MEPCYNIPASLLDAYSDKDLIVRSSDPHELIDAFSVADGNRIQGVQLLGLDHDADVLAGIDDRAEIDLVVNDVSTEFPLLYRYVGIVETRPTWVTIPVTKGFGRAVKVATSLSLPVKLEIVVQPDQSLLAEMEEIGNYCLRDSSVSAPVEFFYSFFMYRFHHESVSLWDIQEEDPAQFLYVSDDNHVKLSRRLGMIPVPENADRFIEDLRLELMLEQGECSTCSFFPNCVGYFKFPDKHYDCGSLKKVLKIVDDAAMELRNDMETFEQTQEGPST